MISPCQLLKSESNQLAKPADCIIFFFFLFKILFIGDPWVAQRFGACLWPRARSWRPGIESHVGLPVHGACFSLCLCLCLSLSHCVPLIKTNKQTKKQKQKQKNVRPNNEFSKVAKYKINTQKSIDFLYTNNELSEEKLRTIPFITAKKIST